jgi:hypothetical protein
MGMHQSEQSARRRPLRVRNPSLFTVRAGQLVIDPRPSSVPLVGVSTRQWRCPSWPTGQLSFEPSLTRQASSFRQDIGADGFIFITMVTLIHVAKHCITVTFPIHAPTHCAQGRASRFYNTHPTWLNIPVLVSPPRCAVGPRPTP